MENKLLLENDFIESLGAELRDCLEVDHRQAYLFALNFTEALSASNADLGSIQNLFLGRS